MPTTTGRASEFITFSRGSLATVTDANSRIVWAPHNLLLASEQFDAASWGGVNLAAFGSGSSANAIAAPNGTTTADKIAESASSGIHSIAQTITTAATTYVFSAFLKKAERSFAMLYHGVSNAGVSVNLDTGATSTPAGISAPVSSSVTSLGDGWYLCSITVNATAAGNAFGIYVMSNASTYSYAGSAGSGIYVWGAHLYRSDLGGMQANASAYPMYNPSTPRNLLGQSEGFDTATWSKNSATAVATSVASPNGSLNARLFTSTSTSYASVSQSVTVAGGSRNTISVYVKAGNHNIVSLEARYNANDDSQVDAYFDLTAVTATKIDTNVTAEITAVSDGWYRIRMTKANPGPGTSCIVIIGGSNVAAGTMVIDKTFYLWGAQLSDSASLDAYVPSFGAAPSAAAAHGARLDYSSSGSALGLLVEEQRTFLALNSNDFTSWTASNTAVTAADAVSPDGATNATKLVFTAGVSANIYKNVSISNIAAHAISFWIKGTAGQTLTPFAENVAGTYAASSPGTVTLTGSWQRVTWVHTPATGNSGVLVFIRSQSADTAKTVWVYGHAVEIGAGGAAANFSTSYMPTAGSTVTRNADVALVGVSQFPYSSSAGTFVANFQTLYSGSHTATTSVVGGDSSGSKLYIYIPSGNQNARSYDGSTVVSATGDVTGSAVKVASGYNASSRAVCIAGGTVATGTVAASYAAASTINIGGETANGPLNGWFRQFTYLPRLLSDAEMQSRTL
jgi:hypothetical protein